MTLSFSIILNIFPFLAAPINDCNIVQRIHMILPVTIPSTTLLFVFRVCALYNNNQYVVAFSSISWLVVLGSSFTVPIGSKAVNIGITKYCVPMKPKSSTSFAIVYPVIHETLVFLATSWAFLQNSFTDVNFTNGFRVMVMGNFLPAFSRSILHNGQAYYLCVFLQSCECEKTTNRFSRASLISFLVFAVTFYDRVPSNLSMLLAWPAFAVLNNMSCYIYRNIRLGTYIENSINTSAIDKALGPPQQPGHSRSSRALATTFDDPQSILHSIDQANDDGGNQVEMCDLEPIHKR